MRKARKSLALAFAVTNATPGFAADWSGPYAGIGAGGGSGQQSQQGGILKLPSSGGMVPPAVSSSSPTSSPTSTATSTSTATMTSTPTITTGTLADGRYGLSGGLVGGGVGYNWQRERLVYGASLDGAWADISGSGTCSAGTPLAHACGGGINALGTARAHIGYDILGPALGAFSGMQVFVSGGLAVAHVHAWDSYFATSGDKTIAGYTFGGGVEAMFAEHWSISFEYLHIDLGNHAVFSAAPPMPERVRTTADIARIGLNYHFSFAGVPTLVTP